MFRFIKFIVINAICLGMTSAVALAADTATRFDPILTKVVVIKGQEFVIGNLNTLGGPSLSCDDSSSDVQAQFELAIKQLALQQFEGFYQLGYITADQGRALWALWLPEGPQVTGLVNQASIAQRNLYPNVTTSLFLAKRYHAAYAAQVLWGFATFNNFIAPRPHCFVTPNDEIRTYQFAVSVDTYLSSLQLLDSIVEPVIN